MNMYEIAVLASAGLSLITFILMCVVTARVSSIKDTKQQMDAIRREINGELREARTDSAAQNHMLSSSISESLSRSFSREDARLISIQKSVNDQLSQMENRLAESEIRNETKLENVRTTMERKLAAIQEDNSRQLTEMRNTVDSKLSGIQADNEKQLTEMRNTVDEKLQKTLEDRIGQSFRIVSERLEQVYRGLGEMQNLAVGVGDLKKVLTNVKTRGIFGEIQLGAILEQMLSNEQYETNVVTRPGSKDPVEYAVKFPGEDGESVYLPIDSKFPMDVYQTVLDAYDTGDKERIDAAVSFLCTRIKQEAKKIREKYIEPPYTTDFAVMFLPIEGLYAEVVRSGLVNILQQEYRVSIAGPTTMAALLNSLQMGFRTLAIQKRSGEVWRVLGEVKTEFSSFQNVLESAQNRIMKANEDLDKLVGVRTRQIQRKLKDVESIAPTREETGYLE